MKICMRSSSTLYIYAEISQIYTQTRLHSYLFIIPYINRKGDCLYSFVCIYMNKFILVYRLK